MLDTAFGLALHYNWKHYLQVEAIVMFAVLCGFCGNANHSSSDGIIATNGTNETTTAPSPVWNHANATESICSVVGSVCHIASVVVATKVPTIFPKRTSGTTNGVMRNVSASQTPRQLSVLRVTARMVKCASF